MKRRIAAGEFKTKCLGLLDEVNRDGNEIVITKRGKPVARLVPLDKKAKEAPEIFGRMRGTIDILGDIVSPIGAFPDATTRRR